FMRSDWHRDEYRADAVMTSLGMARADLPAFLKFCVGAYANQTEGIFAVLKSPFRKFSISADSSDADKGVPIPPRPINKPPEAHRPAPQLSISAADSRSLHPAEQFVAQAKKH